MVIRVFNSFSVKSDMGGGATIVVPCKEDLQSLQKRCQIHGLTINPASLRPPSPDRRNVRKRKYQSKGSDQTKREQTNPKKLQSDEYVVERICDFKIENDAVYYFVQWKGWDESHNSWEPTNHVVGCQKLLKEFYLRASRNGMLAKKLKNLDELYMEKLQHLQLLRETKRCEGKRLQSTLEDQQFSMPPPKRRLGSSSKSLSIVCEVRRSALTHVLKEWERSINAMTPNQPPILVENVVDFEGPPENFTYIDDYQEGEGVVIPQDPLVGCNCEPNCLSSRENCCGHSAGADFAYNRYQKLRLSQGVPIYECNDRCSCDSTCANRVVQHGRKVKLAIFRTSDGRGWGVKTLQKIPSNSFVMEYVGEIITNDEAERRGEKYDAVGLTYLFDLDFNEGDNPYTVDAAHYGNVSHFMNHSCDPNLTVYAVFINTLDLGLPRLAFFTNRSIDRGEELTFDYQMSGASPLNKSAVLESDDDESNILTDGSGTENSSCAGKIEESDVILGQADVRNIDADVTLAVDDVKSADRVVGHEQSYDVINDSVDVTIDAGDVTFDVSDVTTKESLVKIGESDIRFSVSDSIVTDSDVTINERQVKSDIRNGEVDLKTDKRSVKTIDGVVKGKSSDLKRTPCRCGAANCRKFLN